jgi:hypothetical protein
MVMQKINGNSFTAIYFCCFRLWTASGPLVLQEHIRKIIDNSDVSKIKN